MLPQYPLRAVAWRLRLKRQKTSFVNPSMALPATLPSDIVGNIMREDDLIVEPIEIADGYASVPDKPGLGVELDEAAVAKYSVD